MPSRSTSPTSSASSATSCAVRRGQDRAARRRDRPHRRVLLGQLRGAEVDGAHRAELPGGVRRRRARHSSTRPSWPRSWRGCARRRSLTFLISKLGMLPVHQLRQRRAEVRRTCPGSATGEIQASYGLSEPDAGSDVASMTHPGRARRRRLGDHRHQVLDHQRRHHRPLHRLRPHLRPTGTRASPASSSRPTGACRSTSSSTSSASGLARPASSASTRCACPTRNRIGEVGQGFAIAMHTLDRSRPTIGAQAVGIAQGALDYAAGYMKERRTFGRPDRRQPGPAVDGGRHGDADRGRPRASSTGPARMVDDGDPNGELGMVGAMAKCFASRRGHAGDDRRRAAPRRLRLHRASSRSSG